MTSPLSLSGRLVMSSKPDYAAEGSLAVMRAVSFMLAGRRFLDDFSSFVLFFT